MRRYYQSIYFSRSKSGFTKNILLIAMVMFGFMPTNAFAQKTDETGQKVFTHHMTPEEELKKGEIGKNFIATPPPTGPVYNVAEFNRMQAVLVRYPFGISYAIIAEMSQDLNVVTIVASASQQTTVTNNYIANGVNIANCSFLIAPSNSYWTRDYGPWFVFDGNDEPGIVDFPYNRPDRTYDDEIPVEVAGYLGINLFGMNVIHTGGNYMTDGMGISSSSELVWDENPTQTHAQIDEKFEDYLGINTYHVVPDPNNTYIDHIDCWGKFLDVDKVLIRSVPPSHAQYDEIEATAAYYASQTSSYGTPFLVFRVYTPQDQPYTNSIILNEKVLVPIVSSQWDDEALAVYQQAMPGYEVLGFTGSWESTDALHCRAKGIADLGMLRIKHIPLQGNQPLQTEYPITAEIKAYSNQPVYSDSVFIIYAVNFGAWDTILMTNTSGNTYSGNIPGQSYGSQVEYYLYAADQSGRNEAHPLIGQPDAHVFFTGTPLPPEISVNPVNVEETLSLDEMKTQPLVITNSGQLVLSYTLSKQYSSKNAKAYCSSSGGGSDEYIQNVSIGSINNTTGQSYYANYSGISTVVATGQSYPITITNGDPNWSTDRCGIWVDWNQNENFTDDGAIIVSGSPGVGPYTATIIPPESALAGPARMRVQIIYNQTPNPCLSSFSYGEVEDYTLDVVNNFVDWLIIDPVAGAVPGEDSTIVNLTFNSNGLEEGNYYAQITVNSNDPDQAQIIVPVHLEVVNIRFVNLKVFLEGPFNGTIMNTDLTGLTDFPLFQPYQVLPWGYNGTEAVTSVPPNVVDWVLVEYRDAANAATAIAATSIGRQAAFILNDGSVVDLDGISDLQPSITVSQELFVVIYHRNHLAVMSNDPLAMTGGIYQYDFSDAETKAYGGLDGHKMIASGIWGMRSGDGNSDGEVDSMDKNTWTLQSGKSDYSNDDLNFDLQINNIDKNDYWLPNSGMSSQVPE